MECMTNFLALTNRTCLAPLLPAVAAIAALSACQTSEIKANPDLLPVVTSNAPGRHDHSLTVDGQDRKTIVYVGAPAQQIDAPVVLVLHGTSQDGEKFYADSRWREQADAVGLIAVFPTALQYCYKEDENGDGDFDDPGELRVSTKWTNGKLGQEDGYPLCTPEELAKLPADRQALVDHPLLDDVAFIDAQLALLASAYRIDAKRVYVTGFSNGASFTSRLVQERSLVFAAAAIGSGSLAVDPQLAPRPMSALQWLGSKDDRFVPVGVELVVGPNLLSDYPLLHDRMVVPMLTVLGLADVPVYSSRPLGNRTVATFTYSTSKNGSGNHYSFSVIEGMYHIYPSGTPAGLVAAEVAWELFEGEALP